MLVAIVPIVLIALFSFSQVTGKLNDAGREELKVATKNYGHTVFTRLTRTSRRTWELIDISDGELRIRTEPGAQTLDQFQWIATVDSAGLLRPLIGEIPADFNAAAVLAESNLDSDISTNIVVSDHNGALTPILFQSKQLADQTTARIMSAPTPEQIWGTADQLSMRYQFHVYDDRKRLLFSTAQADTAIPASAMGELNGHRGAFEFETGDRRYLGDFWSIFMDAQFGGKNWFAVSSREQDRVQAPIKSFKFFFPLIALLSLLVAAGIGSWQIQKRTGPMDRLVAGTRSLARQDYETRIDVDSGDEFEALGHSFNNMAQKIDTQFGILKLLGEIDRSMVDATNISSVAALLVHKGVDIMPGTSLSVSLLNSHDGEAATTWFQSRSGSVDQRNEEASAVVRKLNSARSNKAVEIEKLGPLQSFFNTHHEAGAKLIQIFPISSGEGPIGHIAVGLTEDMSLGQEEQRQFREISERVGIAHAMVGRKNDLYREANFDNLTTLPNRKQFLDRLDRMCMQGRKGDGGFALLFLDLDLFKQINDSMGHVVGDKVLCEIADRLAGAVRFSDSVARLGGDEFTILLSNIDDVAEATRVVAEIQKLFTKPITVDNVEFLVNTSIGVAVYPDNGITGSDLLQNADTAMYAAKQEGSGRFRIYESSMTETIRERVTLESELRKALERNELEVHYQPVVDNRTDEVVGAESLIRWRHPERGMVPPDHFIQIAEQSGLIEDIGTFVLRESIAHHKRCRSMGITLDKIAINISARQFMLPEFATIIEQLLDELQFEGKFLELEMTESMLMKNLDHTNAVISQLHARGVRFSIDDFGTGYSSLNYLMKIDADTIKIDKSFIDEIATDPKVCEIIKAIIFMCNGLGKTIITEGVEDEVQMQFLRQMSCHYVQGWYYSKARPSKDFISYAAGETTIQPAADWI